MLPAWLRGEWRGWRVRTKRLMLSLAGKCRRVAFASLWNPQAGARTVPWPGLRQQRSAVDVRASASGEA